MPMCLNVRIMNEDIYRKVKDVKLYWGLNTPLINVHRHVVWAGGHPGDLSKRRCVCAIFATKEEHRGVTGFLEAEHIAVRKVHWRSKSSIRRTLTVPDSYSGPGTSISARNGHLWKTITDLFKLTSSWRTLSWMKFTRSSMQRGDEIPWTKTWVWVYHFCRESVLQETECTVTTIQSHRHSDVALHMIVFGTPSPISYWN